MRVTLVIMSDSSLPENAPKKTHAASLSLANTALYLPGRTCFQSHGRMCTRKHALMKKHRKPYAADGQKPAISKNKTFFIWLSVLI